MCMLFRNKIIHSSTKIYHYHKYAIVMIMLIGCAWHTRKYTHFIFNYPVLDVLLCHRTLYILYAYYDSYYAHIKTVIIRILRQLLYAYYDCYYTHITTVVIRILQQLLYAYYDSYNTHITTVIMRILRQLLYAYYDSYYTHITTVARRVCCWKLNYLPHGIRPSSMTCLHPLHKVQIPIHLHILTDFKWTGG